MDNTVGSLTQLQRSVIIGSILGDGYVRIIPKRKDAFLEINHSYNAKDYVDWKYSLLKEISGSAPKLRKGNGNRLAYRFSTRQHQEITKLFRIFYNDGKKIVPNYLKITIPALAIWYMDDGSKCRSSDVYINTQQFALEDQKRLIQCLQNLGIEARLNRDKHYWRIRIIKLSLPRFKALIRKYIIPSMRYKIEL